MADSTLDPTTELGTSAELGVAAEPSGLGEVGESLLLGVVQGLTEFLPVSSSGHLLGLKALLGSSNLGDQTLDVFLHFATLIAVFLVFRSEFARLFRGLFRGGSERALLVAVILAASPAGIVGLLAGDWVETLGGRFPGLLPVCWLLSAAALLSLRRSTASPESPPASREEDLQQPIGVRAALWVGVWQVLALLPGVSRSGITIAAGIWCGLRREQAASFSFLCATPLILGATLLKTIDLVQESSASAFPLSSYLLGGVVAFFTGWGALIVLLRMLRGGSLHYWAYYLIPAALAYALWLSFGA